MNYRITLDLAFSKQASAQAVLKTAKDHLKNAATINPEEQYEEIGYIQLVKCYHDEDPVAPCEIIETITTMV